MLTIIIDNKKYKWNENFDQVSISRNHFFRVIFHKVYRIEKKYFNNERIAMKAKGKDKR